MIRMIYLITKIRTVIRSFTVERTTSSKILLQYFLIIPAADFFFVCSGLSHIFLSVPALLDNLSFYKFDMHPFSPLCLSHILTVVGRLTKLQFIL